MTLNGALYRLPTPERLIGVIDGSAWVTPTASDTSNRMPPENFMITKNGTIRHINTKGQQSFTRLSQVVKWSTPTANNAKNSTLPPSQAMRDSLAGEMLSLGLKEDGVRINPEWIEQLMGYPGGWTDITS